MSFRAKVYKVVSKIPEGSVLTYKEVAQRAGNPNAARVVGNLMAKNKDWPMIPCHRVVRSGGNVGNWSGKGGYLRKEELLQNEGHIIANGKIRKQPDTN